MTLVEVLFGALILAAAGGLLYGLIANSFTSEKLIDRQVQVDKILVDTAFKMKSQDLDALISMNCRSAAMTPPANPAGYTGVCKAANGLLETGAPTRASGREGLFERRISWTGIYSDEGKVCLELFVCKKLPGGRLADFTLRAFYASPDAKRKTEQRELKFRRAR